MSYYKLVSVGFFSVFIALSVNVSDTYASVTGVSLTGGNVQEVFYATDRNAENPKKFRADGDRIEILRDIKDENIQIKDEDIPEAINGKVELLQQFGNDSAMTNYGICLVSIPESHKIGEVERPFVDFFENLNEDIGIIATVPLDIDELYSRINAGLTHERKRAFIFVHGHNVPFDAAVMRTAQIAYDLDFEGAPILYSWPSKPCWWQVLGCGYNRNESMVESNTTIIHFVDFLTNFFNESDADSVYIIGHSLGTRLVSRAVNLWSRNVGEATRRRLKEVILAASDLSADVFKTEIMPQLTKIDMSTTLYAAINDKALWLSEHIMHDDEERLGQGKVPINFPNNIALIDATNINIDNLGLGPAHSYATDKRPVISDIYYLIGSYGSEKVDTPYRFGITKQSSKDQGYWEFDR